jgi:predicted DNA-binding protein YlxM (UPF0122 family)
MDNLTEDQQAQADLYVAQEDYYNALDEALEELAEELKVSKECAIDIQYLRTRSRWTEELEEELIELHKNGIRPNMNDFGVTKDSQQYINNLISKIEEKYK